MVLVWVLLFERYENELRVESLAGKNLSSVWRQKMKKDRFQIAVAVFAGILFVAVTVAHACIGTAAPREAHDHSRMLSAGLLQASHAEAQDPGCSSIRDCLLSLGAERASHATALISGLHAMPTIVGRPSVEIDRLPSERRRGQVRISVAQAPLYLSKSVLRI